MENRELTRSRAEIVFAELLVEEPAPSASRIHDLCALHPELADDLQRLQVEFAAMRVLLPARAAPAGAASAIGAGPPDLGAFRCVRLLGSGGMGEVWEAVDRTLDRSVAVKLLRDSWMADQTRGQRFLREAQAAGRVQHPGIVAVYQTGEWEGHRYIVQELVPGGRTLRDEIEELRRLPELPPDHARDVAERFAKLASALGAAHAAGIIHRDLKPQNVLLTPQGEPKVADFGVARLVDDASLSRTGEFMGTYFYASPEQFGGNAGAVGESSDVFSLGATLYENLTLSRPFEGDSAREIMRAVTQLDPQPPRVVRKRLPQDLSLVCMKALEKRPEDRYASMADFAADLGRFLAHEPIRARAPSPWRRAWKWSLRHPTIATTLGLSLAASTALALLYVRSERLRVQASDANRSLLAATANLRVESASRDEVIDFLVGMFNLVDPNQSGAEPPSVREVLDKALERVESGAVTDPRVRARLLACFGVVSGQLGDPVKARTLIEKALADLEPLGEIGRIEAVGPSIDLANALVQLGDLDGAEALLVPLAERIGNDAGYDVKHGAGVLASLGILRTRQSRWDEAEAIFDRGDELCRTLPIERETRLWLLQGRAFNCFEAGRIAEARELCQRVVDENHDLLERADPRVLNSINVLGLILTEEDRLEEAEELYLGLSTELERTLDPDHPSMYVLKNNLARVWQRMGRHGDAEALYLEIIALRKERGGESDPDALVFMNNLGTCVIEQGRLDEAEAIQREVWTARRELFGEDDPFTLQSQNNLAYALFRLGRLDEAEALQSALVARTPESEPDVLKRRELLDSIRSALGPQR